METIRCFVDLVVGMGKGEREKENRGEEGYDLRSKHNEEVCPGCFS